MYTYNNTYNTLTTTASSALTSDCCCNTLTVSSCVCSDLYLIADVEKDNKRTMAYNVAGIKIKGEKNFENKTKKTSLHFYGESDVLGNKLKFDKIINIDTDVYNKYDWYVSNGILYVVLFEKINKEPEFNRVEKPKKVVKEEVTE